MSVNDFPRLRSQVPSQHFFSNIALCRLPFSFPPVIRDCFVHGLHGRHKETSPDPQSFTYSLVSAPQAHPNFCHIPSLPFLTTLLFTAAREDCSKSRPQTEHMQEHRKHHWDRPTKAVRGEWPCLNVKDVRILWQSSSSSMWILQNYRHNMRVPFGELICLRAVRARCHR